MTEREKLIELMLRASIDMFNIQTESIEQIADYLLAHGVRVPVTCGECRYGMEYEFSNGNVYFACCDIDEDGTIGFARAVNENGFCDLGERRADNGT